MTNKAKYAELCISENIPFFSQAWWLDVTAGPENWDVVLLEDKGKIQASLPYVIRKNRGLKFLGQSNLSQNLGPWMRTNGIRGTKRLSLEKELMTGLIEGMPVFDHYGQNWHPSIQNWLPFYWAGFEQTTRYTYRFEDLTNLEQIWQDIEGNIKSDIKKATTRFSVEVDLNGSLEDFISLSNKTFARQNLKAPYSDEFLRRLDKACGEKNCRKILIAKDPSGAPHAGAFLVWDKESAYYLIGGGDPELRNSGATSLCMWEAIKFSATVSKSFDFEGSMIGPIEKFFRAFGGTQTSYFFVSKTVSRLLKLKKFLQSLR